MIGPGFSPEARALLRSAKEDGPPRAARAEIWESLEATVAPPVAPSSAPTGTATTAAAGVSMKAAFVGAILGSVLSAGITLVLVGRPANVRVNPAPPPISNVAVDAPPLLPAVTSTLPLAAPPAPMPPAQVLAQQTPTTSRTTHPLSAEDSLSREAALVSEARRSLLRGDAAHALVTLRGARALKARQLEPEELSLEVRALRALDRPEEADAVEAKLRHAYPDHVLAQ